MCSLPSTIFGANGIMCCITKLIVEMFLNPGPILYDPISMILFILSFRKTLMNLFLDFFQKTSY